MRRARPASPLVQILVATFILAVDGGVTATIVWALGAHAFTALAFLVPLALFALFLMIHGFIRVSRGGSWTRNEATQAEPAPEPLLSGPAESVGFVTLLTRTIWFWPALAIAVVFGTVTSVLAIGQAITELRYQSDGERTSGIVIEKTRVAGKSPRYYAQVEMALPGGRTLASREQISLGLWDRLQPGQRVPMLYLRADPTTSRVDDGDDWGEVLIAALIGLLASGVGGTFAARFWHRASADWRILRTGLEAAGQVTAVVMTTIRVNGETKRRIHYTYRDHHGVTHEARSHPVGAVADRWQPGDISDIRYDSQQPDQSVWVGSRYTPSPSRH
ncbi:MAG: DUF3592 domain-containing protein [Chloroflexota bacterium]